MASENPDYYQILGVPQDASFEEIRAAFRERAREYHPDRNPDPDAVDRMQEINEAYEVLRDDDQRAVYDRAHRTFGVSAAQMERAHDIAIAAVGGLAFRLGRAYASGVRDEWTALGVGSENTPNGLWQAMYEAALESALESANLQTAREVAGAAAWHGARSEAARLAARHALRERAASAVQALAVDVSIDITGYIATGAGHRFAGQRASGAPSGAAWRDVYSAVHSIVWRRLIEHGMDSARRARGIEQVMGPIVEEAGRAGFAVLEPYLTPTRAGRGHAREEGGGLGCGGAIIGNLIWIGIAALLFGICNGFG